MLEFSLPPLSTTHSTTKGLHNYDYHLPISNPNFKISGIDIPLDTSNPFPVPFHPPSSLQYVLDIYKS